jgi:hypothetical protein
MRQCFDFQSFDFGGADEVREEGGFPICLDIVELVGKEGRGGGENTQVPIRSKRIAFRGGFCAILGGL